MTSFESCVPGVTGSSETILSFRRRINEPVLFVKKEFLSYLCIPEMAKWPSGQAEVCKTLYSGSNPLFASINDTKACAERVLVIL